MPDQATTDRMREALTLIGTKCRNYTTGIGACWTAGRSPTAKYGADLCCEGCLAAYGLGLVNGPGHQPAGDTPRTCPSTTPHARHEFCPTGYHKHPCPSALMCPGFPDPDPREPLGRAVRQIWVDAVIELIPEPKPSWVQAWADLTDPFQREVDMRIGADLYARGREAERVDWMRSMQTKLDRALAKARDEGAADVRQRITDALANAGYPNLIADLADLLSNP